MNPQSEDDQTGPVPDSVNAPEIVVGLGASAGGVTALKQFFAHVPEDINAAFIVVLHLSPDHDSRLAEVLRTSTTLSVVQVKDRTRIEARHVYVIPPNRILTVEDGHVLVSPLLTPEQRFAPVDLLLRTLAESHGAAAVGVILSGTGHNGSSGIKWIKECGGLVIVQDPGETEYAEMPRNSLATGLVDYTLPVSAMPEAISRFFSRPHPQLRPKVAEAEDPEADSLRELFTLLRLRTGHDFSNYKQGTVMRRVARRMQVRGLPTMSEYVRFFRDSSDEATHLLSELLISVTNFFRDPASYDALERRVIPQLFQDKQSTDQVRVWIAGCATGEESYSLAMLLVECASKMAGPPSIQVFATDLDARAVAIARDGIYTDAEVADVSEARLHRFFVRDGTGHRVRRELRELLLYAHHDLIKDPPFSHLDLIVCRNVMIYLNRAVQQRLIETFHFALRPGGYLFLGASETADGAPELFTWYDKAAHIYESRTVSARLPSLMADPPIPASTRLHITIPPLRPPERSSPADLHRRLLEQYAPPSIVVTEDYRIVHLSDSAAAYLTVPGGEPSRDLLRLVRPELRFDVRAAMHQALRGRVPVEVRGVRLPEELGGGRVSVCVRPVLRDGEPPRGFLLVLLEPEIAAEPVEVPVRLTPPADGPINELETELENVKRQLGSTIEQYESHVEEAKATNEELQAMNEELRSAAEELETSKEELQSVNEELTTVNQELKIKIEELALTNNDFQNFINATDIGTVFLDRALRVKLFTARACDLFHLMQGDIGRPLTHITNTLRDVNLRQDLTRVIERLQPVEREVVAEDDRSYLMRIVPYRTTDDRIDGVVISFLEITSRIRAEAAARTGEQRLGSLIDSATDYAILTLSSQGTVDFWNPGAERMFGYASGEIIGQRAEILFAEGFADGGPDDGSEQICLRKDGVRFACSVIRTSLGGESAGFVWVVRNLTGERDAAAALVTARSGLEERVAERTHELKLEVSRRAEAQDHVTKLMQKLVTSQEEQRARIARDLHDQLGQQLTTLRLTLERFRDRAAAAGAPDEDLNRALTLTRDIDTEVDFLAWELRPALLDDLGLAAALPQYVQDWSTHYGIPTEVRVLGLQNVHPPREVEVTFYRIAQEALNNIVKHSHASRADVILEVREGSLVLVIEDDGVGFDPLSADSAHGIGLLGMRERAVLVDATLDVESSPGSGTTVFLRFPLARKAGGKAVTS